MKQIASLCFAFLLLLPTELLAQDKNDLQDLIKLVKDKGDLQDLIKQLKDKDVAVRLKAAKDLSKLGAIAKDAIPALTFAAALDDDRDVRKVAKESLESIQVSLGQADKGVKRAVPDALMKDLKSNNAQKRVAALRKLADLGPEAIDAGAGIVEFGMLNTPPVVLEAANTALERIDPAAHKLILILVLDDNRRKMDAVRGLESLGPKGKSGLPVLKLYYLQLLSPQTPRPSYPGPVLHAIWTIDPNDKFLINTVLSVISSLATPNRSLGTDNTSVVAMAFELFTDLKAPNKKKIAALIAALNSPPHRIGVARRLGGFGPEAKDALPLLRRLKLDSSSEIREAVNAAIDQIDK